MPWTQVRCPDGELRCLEECEVCSHDEQCLHVTIRETLFEQERHWRASEHTGPHITASALTGCQRSVYLERLHDYAMPPEAAWYSLRGVLIHKIIERPDWDNPYLRRSEARLHGELEGIPLSSQIDNYQQRFLDKGTLIDYKSIGDNGMVYIIQDGAKPEHIHQTNIYAWLARRNGYRVDQIQIVYMSLMNIVATGTVATHTEYLVSPPAKAGKRKNMIGLPVHLRSYASGKSAWKCQYLVPPVPIYTDEQIEEFMRPRLQSLHQAFTAGVMPPLADADIRQWKCNGYCHVRDYCEAFEHEQGRELDNPGS